MAEDQASGYIGRRRGIEVAGSDLWYWALECIQSIRVCKLLWWGAWGQEATSQGLKTLEQPWHPGTLAVILFSLQRRDLQEIRTRPLPRIAHRSTHLPAPAEPYLSTAHQ